MSDDSPTLVRDEDTGDFGLYYPEEDAIEFNVDGETVTAGDVEPDWASPGGWVEVGAEDLTASIEADIDEARVEIEELRGQDLTDEQAAELERVESRLDSMEATVEVNKEVQDGA